MNKWTKSTNKQNLNGLKKKLDSPKGLWADELLAVLWVIQTVEKSATGETPFMLVYGSEAVLPVEIVVHTHRISTFQDNLNNQAFRDALDSLPIVRGDAYLREEIAKLQMARFHDRKVKKTP